MAETETAPARYELHARSYLALSMGLGLLLSIGLGVALNFPLIMFAPSMIAPLALRIERRSLSLLDDGIEFRAFGKSRYLAFEQIAGVTTLPETGGSLTGGAECVAELRLNDGTITRLSFFSTRAAVEFAKRVDEAIHAPEPRQLERVAELEGSATGDPLAPRGSDTPFRESSLTTEDLAVLAQHHRVPVRVRIAAAKALVAEAPLSREAFLPKFRVSASPELRALADEIEDQEGLPPGRRSVP